MSISPLKIVKLTIKASLEAFLFPLCFLVVLIKKPRTKSPRIGMGPVPLINSVYHKRALEQHGWKVTTYVSNVFHITQDFDVRLDQKFASFPGFIHPYISFFWVIKNFDCLYLYFDGGTLSNSLFLWKFEALLFKLAGIKVIVFGYGSDVQEMTRSPNLSFKHAISVDYPSQVRKRSKISRSIDMWLKHGTHIVGGCEWVDYLPGWDSLMISHFCIDTKKWMDHDPLEWKTGSLKILHAPNHRAIKGTNFILQAVEELKKEGLDIELILLERVPNEKVHEVIAQCHLIIDQLVIGWYAMFAIESMSKGIPVICNIRNDLKELYEYAGLLNSQEFPLIHSSPLLIKNTIKELYNNPETLKIYGAKGKYFANKHHSLESVGEFLNELNIRIGLQK